MQHFQRFQTFSAWEATWKIFVYLVNGKSGSRKGFEWCLEEALPIRLLTLPTFFRLCSLLVLRQQLCFAIRIHTTSD